MSGSLPLRPGTRARVPNLPVSPSALPRLLSLLGDEEAGLGVIASAVEQFPAVTVRLLSIANSAWVGTSQPITSVATACNLLGFRVVRSVSIALVVARSFNPSRCRHFDPLQFWCTAFLTADAAQSLASTTGVGGDAEALRTAGLLHGIGLLWMAVEQPDQTSAALVASASDPELSVASALRSSGALDYCEAGALLCAAWQLPVVLTTAIQHQRSADYRGESWRLAATCGMARSMASRVWDGLEALPDALVDAGRHLGVPPHQMAAGYRQIAAKREATLGLAQRLFGRPT